MHKPQKPHNEKERLQALHAYEILDTLPEKEFDDIVEIASEICDSPIALISLVDEDRQWFKSKIGLEVDETARDFSFCAHALNGPKEVFEIEDTHKDVRFADNPLVTDDPHINYYAGAPLVTPNGLILGTLCVIDRTSRSLDDNQKKALMALSRQVMSQLELRKKNKDLKQSRALFQKLIESVGDYVFETDGFGQFTYCNPLIPQDTGYSKEELLRLNYLDIVHEDDKQRVQEFFESAAMQGKSDLYIQFKVQTKKNPEKPIIVGQKTHLVYDKGLLKEVRAIARNITHEVELQEELDEKAELYQLISESAQDIVCLHDIDGSYTYVSPSIKENLGYTPEEILGKTPYDFMHPDDFDRVRSNAHEKLIRGDKQNFVEYRMKNSEGEYIWFESASTSILDEQGEVTSIRSSTRNIKIRKAQESIINDQNFKLESFVLATPVPVAMFDRNINYIAHSNQWLKSYGLEGKEIIGKNHYDIFPEIGDEWKKIHQNCLNGATHKKDEDPFERADGSTQWLKWEVRPWYNRGGEIAGIIMLTEDISRFKQQENELIEAKEKAEMASEAKANFLSVMSHEIRTPLNAVIGLSHLLLQEGPRADQMQSLNIIRFSSENLLSLVNDILDYNKIEAGKVEIENTTFSLEDLISNIKQAQSFKADEKSVSLKLLYDKDLPHFIVGDSSRLAQIFNNLLSNAIKFTKEGSVRITIEEVQKTEDTVKIYFEFKDSGIGISEENLEKIFDRFVQAESNITRNFGGTGLGLSITKSLLSIMGGEIQVESKIGKGSTFSFELEFPFVEDAAGKVSYSHEYTSDIRDLSEYNLWILLVEDNHANQVVATKFLNNWGIQVDIAVDGFEAIEKIQEKAYNLVFMDLQMPRKDGLSATQEIRELEGEFYQNVPILALTASSDSSTLARTKDYGMDDVVTKPFIPSELYKKVVRYTLQDLDKAKEIPAAPEPEVIPTSEINISDIKENLFSFAGANEEFVVKMFQAFIENLEEFSANYPIYIDERNIEDSRFIMHKVKSTFLMLGQQDIYNDLELSMKAMEEGRVHPEFAKAMILCNELLAQLKGYVATESV